MNLQRIRPTIDTDRMRQSHVLSVGSAAMLNRNLARCGLGSIAIQSSLSARSGKSSGTLHS